MRSAGCAVFSGECGSDGPYERIEGPVHPDKNVLGLPLDHVEFSYIVQATDRDTNGVSVDADAFGGSVSF